MRNGQLVVPFSVYMHFLGPSQVKGRKVLYVDGQNEGKMLVRNGGNGHPELGGRISGDKVRAILDTGAKVVATGNPGCMMQIGAGLEMAGGQVSVVHPLELLDESYRRGGLYT